MWIFLNNAMLSIVQPPNDPDNLLVRARFSGDIEAAFPHAKVTRTPERDYLFRAVINRHLVAATIARLIAAIDYGNFKNSVPEDWRHDAYASVWGVMNREQRARAAPPAPGRPVHCQAEGF